MAAEGPETRVVAVGHVDHGKSTLLGCILADLGIVSERELEKCNRDAEASGAGATRGKSFLFDCLESERERGKTFEYDTRTIEIGDGKQMTLIDCPGHAAFVHEMIAGVSSSGGADAALIVVSARRGEFEDGLNGQTVEHCLLVKALGVTEVVVVINKMDCAEWDQEIFNKIGKKMKKLLKRYKIKQTTCVPAAAVDGINVQTVDNDACPWYDGPSVIEALTELAAQERPEKPQIKRKERDAIRVRAMFVVDMLVVPGGTYNLYIAGQSAEATLDKIKADGARFIRNSASSPSMIQCKFVISSIPINCGKGDRIVVRDNEQTVAIGLVQ